MSMNTSIRQISEMTSANATSIHANNYRQVSELASYGCRVAEELSTRISGYELEV